MRQIAINKCFVLCNKIWYGIEGAWTISQCLQLHGDSKNESPRSPLCNRNPELKLIKYGNNRMEIVVEKSKDIWQTTILGSIVLWMHACSAKRREKPLGTYFQNANSVGTFGMPPQLYYRGISSEEQGKFWRSIWN